MYPSQTIFPLLSLKAVNSLRGSTYCTTGVSGRLSKRPTFLKLPVAERDRVNKLRRSARQPAGLGQVTSQVEDVVLGTEDVAFGLDGEGGALRLGHVIVVPLARALAATLDEEDARQRAVADDVVNAGRIFCYRSDRLAYEWELLGVIQVIPLKLGIPGRRGATWRLLLEKIAKAS